MNSLIKFKPLSITYGIINRNYYYNSTIKSSSILKPINNSINNNNNNNVKNFITPIKQSSSNNDLINNYSIRYYGTTTGKIKEIFEDFKDNLIDKVVGESPKKVDRDYITHKGELNYYFEKLPNNNRLVASSLPPPPIAIKKDYTYNIHGNTIKDPYHYLQNIDTDPDVIGYIEKENQYKETFEKLQLKPLSKKIQSIFKKVFVDHPLDNEIINGYKFIMENKSLYRERISDGKVQLLLLDGENIFGNKVYLRDIINFKFSEDGTLFSFVLEVGNGNEKKVCIIKKVSDFSAPVLDLIDNVATIEWGKGNELFYTQPDEITHRTHKIFKKIIKNNIKLNDENENPSELMIHELNQSYFLDIIKSKDNQFLFYCCNSKASTLIYYSKLENGVPITSKSHKIMLSRVDGLEYYAEHNGNEFYIFANANKGDLNIYKTKDTIENGSLNDLELFVASENGCVIRDVDMYRDYLVIVDLYQLKPRIRIIAKDKETKQHFDQSTEITVTFPQEIIQITLGVNIDYNCPSNQFSITYSTPTENITPANISLLDGSITKLKGSIERGPLVINPDNFETKILWVPSSLDSSVKIPLSIVYNKNACKFDGNTPCILYGYGSYGNINELTHNLEDLFLLNAGMIIAKAHVRGGGELGRSWYHNGKLLNKKNTFSDYIDCVEYLFKNQYTSPNYLIGRGSSAGGLLMCNVALTHPHYFSGIIAQVPFSDILTTMLDDTLPLTIHEYDEWGNPKLNEIIFNYIKQYDPYTLLDTIDFNNKQLINQSLPNLYITGSSNDFRVPYWQPLKFVAKLRNKLENNNNNNNPIILLGINDDTGHFGPNDRDSLIKKWSNELSFIFNSIKKSLNKNK